MDGVSCLGRLAAETVVFFAVPMVVPPQEWSRELHKAMFGSPICIWHQTTAKTVEILSVLSTPLWGSSSGTDGTPSLPSDKKAHK